VEDGLDAPLLVDAYPGQEIMRMRRTVGWEGHQEQRETTWMCTWRSSRPSRAGPMTNLRSFGPSDRALTADQARSYAGALLAAADRLDEIRGAHRS
jgi:hypothetical protein